MLELTALIVIGLLYIIPISIPLYNISAAAANALFQGDVSQKLAASIFYTLFAGVIFTALYYIIKYLFFKEKNNNNEVSVLINIFLSKCSRGQNRVNIISTLIILILLFINIISMIFDIKLMVFGILCIAFVYRNGKFQSSNKKD